MIVQLLPAIISGVKALAGAVTEKSRKTAEVTGRLADRLAARADWLIGLVFVVWAFPMVHGYMNPEEAGRLAQVLAELPSWYVQGFTEISYGAAGAAAVMRMLKR